MDSYGSSPIDYSSPTSYPDFPGMTAFAYDGASSDSSASPTMVGPTRIVSEAKETDHAVQMYASLEAPTRDYYPFSPEPPQLPDPRSINTTAIEFTDLTAPYDQDRRRRRSNPKRDKDAISNMHMRRRAQNRASQRAFRERKERHVHQLEHQLEDLETRHARLLDSHSTLDRTNDQLRREVDQLRNEILSLKSARDTSLSELLAPDFFDRFMQQS